MYKIESEQEEKKKKKGNSLQPVSRLNHWMICMAVDFYCKAIYALMCGLFFTSSHTFLFEDEGSSVQSTLPSVEPLRGANLSRGMAHRALNSYSSHRALVSSPVSASPSVDGHSREE